MVGWGPPQEAHAKIDDRSWGCLVALMHWTTSKLTTPLLGNLSQKTQILIRLLVTEPPLRFVHHL